MTEKFVSPCPPPTPHEAELLVILMEECAEVAQRAAKMLRFGVQEIQPGQPFTNAQRLSQELGDLGAVVGMLVELGLVDDGEIGDAVIGKQEKLDRFMQTSLS